MSETRIRKIRIFKCSNRACQAVIHDHGHEKARMIDVMACPRCKKPMEWTEALYSVTTPDPKFPTRRVAVRLEVA